MYVLRWYVEVENISSKCVNSKESRNKHMHLIWLVGDDKILSSSAKYKKVVFQS